MQLFNLEIAIANLGPLLAGLLMTVELTVVVIVISLVFALLVALGGMSRFTPLRWLVKCYIEAIRGTPLLLQLIYVYYVLPEIGIRLNSFTAGVIALTLNYSAYLSEVYRGGMLIVWEVAEVYVPWEGGFEHARLKSSDGSARTITLASSVIADKKRFVLE